MKKEEIKTVAKSNKFFAISLIAAFVVVAGIAGFVLYNRQSEIIIDIDPIPADPTDPEVPEVPEVPIEYDDLSVLFHQSYVNDTTQSLNSTENTISVEVPSDSEFNASNTEIEVSNMQLFDSIQTKDVGGSIYEDGDDDQIFAASFTISTSCYLKNFSINGKTLGGTYTFQIYNSTSGKPGGTRTTGFLASYTETNYNTGYRWIGLNESGFANLFLNVSETENNTFFVALRSPLFEWQRGSNAEQLNYRWDTTDWTLRGYDYSLSVELTPFETVELVEDKGTTILSDIRGGVAMPIAASFTIPSSCYIKSISVYGTAFNANMKFRIINSSWDGAKSYPSVYTESLWDSVVTAPEIETPTWVTLSDINQLLNTEQTENRTFFLSVEMQTLANFRWAHGSLTSDQDVYISHTGAWDYRNVDLTFNITLSTPTAELTINETAIENGNWQSSEQFNSNTQFVLGGWNNFSADITSVQMNFTKTFNVSVEELETSLRVVIPVSGFEEGFVNQYVRVTIDEAFEITSITYNSVELLEDDFERSGVNVFIYADFSALANLVFSFPIAAKQED